MSNNLAIHAFADNQKRPKRCFDCGQPEWHTSHAKQPSLSKVIAWHESEIKRLCGITPQSPWEEEIIDQHKSIHKLSLNEINSGRLNEE